MSGLSSRALPLAAFEMVSMDGAFATTEIDANVKQECACVEVAPRSACKAGAWV